MNPLNFQATDSSIFFVLYLVRYTDVYAKTREIFFEISMTPF